MLLQQRFKTQMLAAVTMLLSTAGCLSLGGGDTYVQEKPETASRISALEKRVSALEQSFGGSPAPEELPRIAP